MLRINPQKGKLQEERHIKSLSCEKSSKYEGGHNAGTLHCVTVPCFVIPNIIHVHVDGLVQDCRNSSALAMELLQSWTKPSMYCYPKPVLASWDDKYTVGSGTIHAGVLWKYVAWLHVPIALWTSQGSHVHTLFLRWYALVVFQTGMEKLLRSLAFQPISNDCKYRSHSASTVLI